MKPPRRKVLRYSAFVNVSWARWTLYLECGHVASTNRLGKTHGCRQCWELRSPSHKQPLQLP